MNVSSFISSNGISVHAESPIFYAQSDRTAVTYLTNYITDYEHEIRATGGYWSCTINLMDRIPKLDQWLAEGLAKHIMVSGPDNFNIWEGFVNRIVYTTPRFSVVAGPLLNTGNRVRVMYSRLDPNDNNSVSNARFLTPWYDNTSSQKRYGIINKIYSGHRLEDADATRMAVNFIQDPTRSWPPVSRESRLGGSDSVSLQIECLGYWHWFKTYYYDRSLFSGSQTFTQRIWDVLLEQPNSIFGTSEDAWQRRRYIVDNQTRTPFGQEPDTVAESELTRLLSQGDDDGNLYTMGVYDDRLLYYQILENEVTYFQNMSGSRDITTGAENTVKPFEVRPGKFIMYTDVEIGQSFPLTLEDFGSDTRIGYLDAVRYRIPDTLDLSSVKLSSADQFLARSGLGSIS